MAASTISPPQRRLRREPIDEKVTPPRVSTHLVARRSLVAQLRGSDAEVVSVIAPAGYGKTTLLAQWAHSDQRPFAWLTINSHDAEPHILLTHLALAVDALEPDDGTFGRPTRTDAHFAQEPSSRLERIYASGSRPFVLVLDDVHRVRRPDSVAVLAALIDRLPAGSKLVLAGRSDAALR